MTACVKRRHRLQAEAHVEFPDISEGGSSGLQSKSFLCSKYWSILQLLTVVNLKREVGDIETLILPLICGSMHICLIGINMGFSIQPDEICIPWLQGCIDYCKMVWMEVVLDPESKEVSNCYPDLHIPVQSAHQTNKKETLKKWCLWGNSGCWKFIYRNSVTRSGYHLVLRVSVWEGMVWC